ncbi:unnamed protein product [Peronospora farinosa]|uniref:Retrovirus-related Pol polyprotein from transposon TNT 1-94-like beta-barrel domain-containing protein n=1 Tax=Peronospora farinosa TaxID=134698 RepID=A0AAV0U0B5_9STRA|nr:unnamed protein product [Peronospora farinosa]
MNDSRAGAISDWILDSGASRHIVSDDRLLIDSKQYNDKISLADNKKLVLTKVGRARLFVTARGKQRHIELSDVYYAPSLALNPISYGKLEQLEYALDGREVVRRSDGHVAFKVTMRNSVLVVETSSAIKTAEVIFAALEEKATADVSPDVQEATLVNFHQRFGHMSYDTIEKIAKNPGSGLRITDYRRLTCIMCAQSKQTKNSQRKKITGAQSPIDRVGGVICCNLKGPLTPANRLRNRYLVNLVDHKSVLLPHLPG